MPIYEYRCDECGETFEVLQKFSDEPVETCRLCGGSVRKVLHPAAIHFKGSGFYTTDYAKKSVCSPSGESKSADTKGDGKGASKESADTSSASGRTDKVAAAKKAAASTSSSGSSAKD